MTKRRAPLTFDLALIRIIDLIGWEAAAQACNRAQRTVQNWTNPDTPEACPIDCAERLDLAYQAAGGEGAPMFECYATRLETGRAEVFADQVALSRHAERIAKEGGEAISAIIRASRDGATEEDRREALRETEELAIEINKALPLLVNRPRADGGAQQ